VEPNLGCSINWVGFIWAGTTPGRVIVRAADSVLDGCYSDAELDLINVKLLINNSESDADDFVVKEKPSGTREAAWPKDGVAGPNDNHIPLKVQLEGAAGFSTEVKLDVSSTGSADANITEPNGSPYPSGGALAAKRTSQ
jgi:hypothetical protein